MYESRSTLFHYILSSLVSIFVRVQKMVSLLLRVEQFF